MLLKNKEQCMSNCFTKQCFAIKLVYMPVDTNISMSVLVSSISFTPQHHNRLQHASFALSIATARLHSLIISDLWSANWHTFYYIVSRNCERFPQ